MAKIKNTELKEKNSVTANVKEGKLEKKQTQNMEKSKNGPGKALQLNKDLKKEGSELDPKSKNVMKVTNKTKNVPAKKLKNAQFNLLERGKSTEEKKSEKLDQMQSKIKSASPQTKFPSKELVEGDPNKAAKTNVKKIAKVLNKIENTAVNGMGDGNSNSVNKMEVVDTSATEVNAISNQLLAKKAKKAEKKKLLKEQNLAEKQPKYLADEAYTVFVGNLPVNTKRVQLARLFKKFAPIKYIRLRTAGGKVLHKHKQRKAASSLNAYVTLSSEKKAENAVSLNGTEFKGNHLRVTLATKNFKTPYNEEKKKTVFVGNLKFSATEESLHEVFSSCGEIDYVRCIRDGDKGCKGVAYVSFKTAESVGLALELNGTIVDERPINVERYNLKKLGAKETREAKMEKENKSKVGVKQRIENKKMKMEKSTHSNNNGNELDDVKKPKKSEFRGVKVEGLKKKQKSIKKKSKDKRLQLAKKIAPKIKTD